MVSSVREFELDLGDSFDFSPVSDIKPEASNVRMVKARFAAAEDCSVSRRRRLSHGFFFFSRTEVFRTSQYV